MRLTICPDVNVWLALAVGWHQHHTPARAWFESLPADARLWFCRVTQMGLLRLLTQESVMGRGAALSQAAAWESFDYLSSDALVGFMPEPSDLDAQFRIVAHAATPMPKRWGDDYLIAFANTTGSRLATLDRSLSRRAEGAILIA